MSDKPIKVDYAAPDIGARQINSYNDLKNGLQWLGVNAANASPNAFAGHVAFDGSADTPFPDGWTSEQSSTGTYKITHNLNSTSYVLVAIATGGTRFIEYSSFNANDCTIQFFNSSASLTDTEFSFILVLNA